MLINSNSSSEPTPGDTALSVDIAALPAMSRAEPAVSTQHGRITYHGRKKNGRFRVQCDDQKFLVNGAIYALSKGTDHLGNALYLKLLLDMTPGYRIEPADEHTFDAVCVKTGGRMFIQGRSAACASAI